MFLEFSHACFLSFAMASSTTRQVLSLYRSLIRESKKISAYNFRNYALRKVRDSFRQNMNLKDPTEIAKQIAEGQRNLEILKRQVIIGQLYGTEKLVIEHLNKSN